MEVDTRWVLRWVLCPALPACPSQTLPAYTLPGSGCFLISSSPFHTPRASPSSSGQPGWLEQTNLPPAVCNWRRRDLGSGWKTSGSVNAAGPWGRSRPGRAAAEAGTP